MKNDIEKANQIVKDGEELARRYTELIMAVGSKFPGETRHETALRYIREREESGNCSATIEENSQTYTLEEIKKYFAGWKWEKDCVANGALNNALTCLDDPCDGIAAWKNRKLDTIFN